VLQGPVERAVADELRHQCQQPQKEVRGRGEPAQWAANDATRSQKEDRRCPIGDGDVVDERHRASDPASDEEVDGGCQPTSEREKVTAQCVSADAKIAGSDDGSSQHSEADPDRQSAPHSLLQHEV
jgi:hypothetical protein